MANTWNPQYPAAYSDSYAPDVLIAGSNVLTVTDGTQTLVSGQNLARGALLGKITSSGKLTLSLNAAADGSQTPYAILAEGCNASAGDAQCAVYLSGEFNANAVIFGTGQTVANTKDVLRDANIYLKSFVPAT